jgi:hypothetical protein
MSLQFETDIQDAEASVAIAVRLAEYTEPTDSPSQWALISIAQSLVILNHLIHSGYAQK